MKGPMTFQWILSGEIFMVRVCVYVCVCCHPVRFFLISGVLDRRV